MEDEFLPLLSAILFCQDSFFSPSAKQAELAKRHEQYVLLLNQTLEEKAAATIYINDTYTRMNFEREEIELQKQCMQETTQLIEKQKQDYLEKKEYLAIRVSSGIYYF